MGGCRSNESRFLEEWYIQFLEEKIKRLEIAQVEGTGPPSSYSSPGLLPPPPPPARSGVPQAKQARLFRFNWIHVAVQTLARSTTGMHIVVVEALLDCYLPRKRADTYRHKKALSVECLSRAISWSVSS
jgi:hypothetical protein